MRASLKSCCLGGGSHPGRPRRTKHKQHYPPTVKIAFSIARHLPCSDLEDLVFPGRAANSRSAHKAACLAVDGCSQRETAGTPHQMACVCVTSYKCLVQASTVRSQQSVVPAPSWVSGAGGSAAARFHASPLSPVIDVDLNLGEACLLGVRDLR